MANGDTILRAYAILTSLKNNLPNTYEVEQSWAQQFNTAVTSLESTLGVDLTEFKLSDRALSKSVSSYNAMTGGNVRYREGLWCQRSVLMQKIDALLVYFSGLQREDEKRIGFHVAR